MFLSRYSYALLDGSTAHAAVVAADSGGDLEVSSAARAA